MIKPLDNRITKMEDTFEEVQEMEHSVDFLDRKIVELQHKEEVKQKEGKEQETGLEQKIEALKEKYAGCCGNKGQSASLQTSTKNGSRLVTLHTSSGDPRQTPEATVHTTSSPSRADPRNSQVLVWTSETLKASSPKPRASSNMSLSTTQSSVATKHNSNP